MKQRFRSYARGSKEYHNTPLPFPLLAAALTLVFMMSLTAGLANGPLNEAPACPIEANPDPLMGAADWRVVADRTTGLALMLPSGHELVPTGDIWYVHGTLDGEPLVPDVFIQLHRNRSVEEVAGELFAVGATLEPVPMGPATHGFRVIRLGQAGAEGYLLSGEAGTYSIVRYEDFDWVGFEQVGCSIHFIELVSGQD